MTTKTLWGQDDSEYLYVDKQTALEYAIEEAVKYSDREYPSTLEVEIVEFSTFPAGEHPADNFPSGATIATELVERWCEEWDEQMYEQYMDHASDEDVVAAFQAARDLLVSKQTFLVADRVLKTERYKIILEAENVWRYEPLGPA